MGLGQGRILKSAMTDIYRYLLRTLSHQHHCSGKRCSGSSHECERIRIKGQRNAFLIFDGRMDKRSYISAKNPHRLQRDAENFLYICTGMLQHLLIEYKDGGRVIRWL